MIGDDPHLGRRVWADAFPIASTHGGAAVTLTFDDGPNPVHTPSILATLRKHNAPATFFMLGQNIDRHGDVANQVRAAGHQLGNHTYLHHNSIDLDSSEWKYEVERTKRLIGDRDGGRLYFRFPYGHAGRRQLLWMAQIEIDRQRYVPVGWHVDSLDWAYHRTVIARSPRERQRMRMLLVGEQVGDSACTSTTVGPAVHPFWSMIESFTDWVLFRIRQSGGGIVLLHDRLPITDGQLDAILTGLNDPAAYWSGQTASRRDDLMAFYEQMKVDPMFTAAYVPISSWQFRLWPPAGLGDGSKSVLAAPPNLVNKIRRAARIRLRQFQARCNGTPQ
jgi:peptidoglycan/xylan/chitin deacetylase (PgdA/CDA1 family)